MDRPKPHWFVFLGFALAAVISLLARGLLHGTEDDTARVAVTQTHPESVPPAAATVQEPQSSSAPLPDVKRPQLRGQVIDAATRQAVRQFEIQLQRMNTTNEEAPIARRFQSNTGTFEWKDAPVGDWFVTVTAPDYQRFEVRELSIAVGQPTGELKVPLLRGYKVTGRVFDEGSGAAIADASVTYHEASADIGEARSGHVLSNKDGSFVFEGVPQGRISLQARSMEHAEQRLEIGVSAQTAPVAIGLASGGAISGFVVTTGGAPIAAPVVLINEQNFSLIKRSSDNGAFSFDHLAAGRYGIAIGMVGGAEIALASGERREGIVLTAPSQGRSVRGTVTGLRRDERAFVVLRSETRGAHAMRPVDAQGEFVLNGVPLGRAELRVEVSSSPRTVLKSIEVPADKDLVVNVELPAGVRLSGRVTQGGKPVAVGNRVWIYPVPRDRGSSYHARTAANGTYRVEGIAAGEYDVMAAANVSHRISIADQDVVLDLEMPPVQLAGRVIEDGGTAPIVGAHVYATWIAADLSRVRPNDASDHFGQFKLAGLESGEVVVPAYKRGYELFRERIDYTSPITDMTIKLRPGSGVEVRAHAASTGEALRELQVTEYLDGRRMGIIVSMQLDENGVGSLPQGLAGSTLSISGGGRDMVVREWDGHALDLNFR